MSDENVLVVKGKRSTHTLVLATPVATGSATGNYEDLTNKPSINGVELIGNLSSSDLGIGGGGSSLTPLTIADLNALLHL